MKSTEPEIVAVRQLPDGTTVNIYGGFPRKARELYPATIQEFKKHDDGSLRFHFFVHEVLDGADHARAWQRAQEAGRPDPNEARRHSNSDFPKEARKAAAAVRRLVRRLERQPDRSAQALGRALLKIKGEDGRVPLHTLSSDANGVNVFAYGPGTHTDVIFRLLSHTADGLEETPPAKAGPWMHRCQVGPLLYPSPIDTHSGRPDALVNGLLFGTALLSRQFTAASPWAIQPGMVMPTRACVGCRRNAAGCGAPLVAARGGRRFRYAGRAPERRCSAEKSWSPDQAEPWPRLGRVAAAAAGPIRPLHLNPNFRRQT